MPEEDKIRLFNRVLARWREPGLPRVRPAQVIPDTTNRSNTGLSVGHVHWIATKIGQEGFQPRSGSGVHSKGHDIPIVVRESRSTPLGPESLRKWQAQQKDEPDFPPLRMHLPPSTTPGAGAGGPAAADSDASSGSPRGEFFASLGNGHFFQALNLYGAGHRRRFPDPSPHAAGPHAAAAIPATAGGIGNGNGHLPPGAACQTRSARSSSAHGWYSMSGDGLLRAAVGGGVEAVVLSPQIPRRDRRFLSEVLNSSAAYTWHIGPNGDAAIDPTAGAQREDTGTAFDSLSKSLDAHELDSLVRQKLKLDGKRERARRQRHGTKSKL